MKILILAIMIALRSLVCFAELHTPDTILTTEESLLQQEINIRRTAPATPATIAHTEQEFREYRTQNTLPAPEIIPFQQALYPIVYYQPPVWQVQAWQRQQAAMRMAAYYPPAPEMFPMSEPEPEPTPTPRPRPTATPQPTPAPIVQERVIIERVITVYITPTPMPTPTVNAEQELVFQHIRELEEQLSQQEASANRWGMGLIGSVGLFCIFLFMKRTP